MTVEYRVLGALEVRVDGTGVDIVGRHHPKVLALLLESENQVVPHDRLIEALWDASPPKTARYQVQNVIGSLRRQLGPAGDGIETSGIGYRLAVEPGRSDLSRARTAIARAARSRRAGDLTAALTDLRAALSEWRGPALTGITGRLLETMAAQLEQLRLQALDERFGVELELGNHAAVLGELTETVVSQPLREDFHVHYLLALHRAGRTPEALRAYSDLATRLTEELGTGPGRRIRDLHTAILREDPRLLAPAPAAAPAAAPATRPAQLPADPPGFTGRAESLSELDALLSGDSRACVLVGAAGSGKTSLAVHWSHQVRDTFPDGQLFIDLRGFDRGEPVTPADALSRFIRALRTTEGPVPADADEAATLYRSLTDGKRMLVVLDNAHDAAQVRPLLPSGDCATIVTSRNRLSGLTAIDGALPVAVAPLPPGEAVDMLAATLDPERVHAEPEAVHHLARLCGNLPLALRIAAAHLAADPGLPVADYAARLRGTDLVTTLSIAGDPDATVAGALDLSFNALDADTALLFDQLGQIPGEDFALAMVAAVAEATEPDTQRRLNRLVAAHLLEEHHPGRYRFHDLVRGYAAHRSADAITATGREALVERFIEWHFPQASLDSPAEDTNILVACETLRDHPKLWRLVSPLNRAINAGHHEQRIHEFVRVALDHAERHGDLAGRFAMTSRLATIHWLNGRSKRCVELGYQVAAIAERLGPEQVGRAKSNLSVFLRDAGQGQEAVRCALDSLAVLPDDADPDLVARRLLNLCIIHRELGDLDLAFDAVCRTPMVDDAASMNLNLLRIREFKASLLVDTGRYDEALPIYTEVLTAARRSSNLRFVCVVQIDRGAVRLHSGDTEGALADLREGLAVAEQIGHFKSEITALCMLARSRLALADPEGALEYARTVADRAREHGSSSETDAQIAHMLCEVHTGTGDHRAAVAHGTRAVEAYAAMSRRLLHRRALSGLAEAYRGLGDTAAEARYRRRAAEVRGTIAVLTEEQLDVLRAA